MKKTLFGGFLFIGGCILLAGAVIASNGMSNSIAFPGTILMILGILLSVFGLRKE